MNPVAQILDTGNLVVWDNYNNISTKRNPIWESFDYPGDTFLPGMKLGKDLVKERERYMSSWKSPDDPSLGVYDNWVNTNGYPQIFGRRLRVPIYRHGPWNGLGFSGFPIDILNRISSIEFVVNETDIFYQYQLISSVVQRTVLTWDGKTLQLNWIKRIQEWVVYANVAVDDCNRYSLCGPYGICSINKHPPCSCMEGFEPRFQEEWKEADWSGGCQRKKRLDCESEDGFWKITGVKSPDTQHSWYNRSMTLEECKTACERNCSCMAYANLDIRNGGSGCLLWFDELIDIREYDEDHDLYIRMAASELAGRMVSQSGLNKKRVLTVVLSILSAALFLSIVAYALIL